MKKTITIDKIKSDLAGFDSSNLTYSVVFNKDNKILGCNYNPDTDYLNSINFEIRNEDTQKVLDLGNYFDDYYGTFAGIRSNNIDDQSNFISSLSIQPNLDKKQSVDIKNAFYKLYKYLFK
ncbi:hypothetical protein [Romboutsia sp.]|uniref:hypothetical protein n=1 Tax=Romboutsia sp. TaxID=1965302 RepID=UPI003F33E381